MDKTRQFCLVRVGGVNKLLVSSLDADRCKLSLPSVVNVNVKLNVKYGQKLPDSH